MGGCGRERNTSLILTFIPLLVAALPVPAKGKNARYPVKSTVIKKIDIFVNLVITAPP
jgi:hypothetical protein